ncbi:hypothetical protein STEG23_002781 [Scotinomys teguina]
MGISSGSAKGQTSGSRRYKDFFAIFMGGKKCRAGFETGIATYKMGKFMKSRKVLVLAGAVTVKNIDDGTSDHPYSHALVAGIDCYPLKMTAAVGKKKITKRSKIKSSVKVYNDITSHLLGTLWTPPWTKPLSTRCL